MNIRRLVWVVAILVGGLAAGCGGGGGGDDDPDVVTVEHCTYAPVPATAGAGGTVTSGALTAGTAEALIDMPVGSALGSYTARAGFLGSAGTVDLRRVALSGNFNASIGIETAPKVRALALSAGSETVVIVKLDIGYGFEGLLFELEERLGPELSGKIIMTHSHTHSAWGHYTAHSGYQMGAGVFRDLGRQRFLDSMEGAARAALDARQPAKIGFFSDLNFDPNDEITRDRRGENDELMGGSRKDDALFMIRIDALDDSPMAIMPVYGVHGTLNDEDNSLASTDAPGGMERWVEEQFDRKVLVMHLQGAAGDVSPKPRGRINCDIKPGDDDDPCFDWLQADAHGRAALPTMMAAWQAAGADMKTDIELEMLTRSVELGPFPETFTIRDGALEYAPFERDRVADRMIYDGDGNVISPIDEFNAPVGAGLCESDEVMFSAGEIPGTRDLAPYASCARVGALSAIFSILLDTPFESDETHPICGSTRTTLSALRIGDYVFGTLPGEATVSIADLVREKSPVAPEKTIVLGFSQGHVGYLLRPEDWIAGGYEASINMWGPLEAEYLAEQLLALMPLVTTADREDGTTGGVDRWVTPDVVDDLPIDDPAPLAGTIPDPVPERVWLRTGSAAQAQPAATIRRVSGIATFVWIGDDPLVATPEVRIEREVSPGSGTYQAVQRRSGRDVRDGDFVLAYTPLPVRRVDDEPQTHYWTVEWQAVPWTGADDDNGASLDSLGARAGVPLARYRFHAIGASYDITSDPFDVVEADLGVVASRDGNAISAAVSLLAAKGYRVLDMDLASNEAVPVREGHFDVVLTLSAGSPLTFNSVSIDSDGNVTVDAGSDTANVTQVTVTDAYGNTKTVNMN